MSIIKYYQWSYKTPSLGPTVMGAILCPPFAFLHSHTSCLCFWGSTVLNPTIPNQRPYDHQTPLVLCTPWMLCFSICLQTGLSTGGEIRLRRCRALPSKSSPASSRQLHNEA